MKCYTLEGTGLESLRLEDRPDPGEPGPGEVLAEVHCVSLNYRDLLMAKGQYGQKETVRFVPCSDMSGVVLESGVGVSEFQKGDAVVNSPFRVWPAGRLRAEWARTFVGAPGVDGVLAERVRFPAAALVKMPAHFSFPEGSTLTVAGLTAWSAIHTHGKAKPGDWVLLHGTGGVSVFGAQIARMLSARTILTTSSEEKARIVKEKFGVHETVNYLDETWPKQVRKITGGGGVDVVADVVGGSSLAGSLKACAIGGRVSLIGLLGGVESTIMTLEMISKQLTIRGIYMESTEELRSFAQACETSELHPFIDRIFPLEEARQAYEHLQSRKHIGKIVIEVK